MLALHRFLDLAHAIDPALGVGESAVFLEERRARKKHMGKGRRFIQEQILHDNAIHVFQRFRHMPGIWI